MEMETYTFAVFAAGVPTVLEQGQKDCFTAEDAGIWAGTITKMAHPDIPVQDIEVVVANEANDTTLICCKLPELFRFDNAA